MIVLDMLDRIGPVKSISDVRVNGMSVDLSKLFPIWPEHDPFGTSFAPDAFRTYEPSELPAVVDCTAPLDRYGRRITYGRNPADVLAALIGADPNSEEVREMRDYFDAPVAVSLRLLLSFPAKGASLMRQVSTVTILGFDSTNTPRKVNVAFADGGSTTSQFGEDGVAHVYDPDGGIQAAPVIDVTCINTSGEISIDVNEGADPGPSEPPTADFKAGKDLNS